jgi:PAB1-binding protein PBP1
VGDFGRERELMPWTAAEDSNSIGSLDDANPSDAKWDQFAANEKMFGVKMDFNEELYTTVIDKSDPLYKKKEAEALRLAREIEGDAMNVSHITFPKYPYF